jgi:hypothetical protein
VSLEAHPKESPVLHGAISRVSSLDTHALSGSDGWRSVLQCLENVENALASAHLCLVAGTRSVAVGLILCPLAAYVASAPTLIAFLYACEVEGTAITAVFALGNSQGCVSVCIHVELEDRAGRILGVAPQGVPGGRGRRKRRSFARASGGRLG